MLNLPKCVYEFADLLPKKSYVVGGFVRDSLMNKTPSDVDICSKLHPNKLSTFLKDTNFKILSTSTYGTAKIEYRNNVQNFSFEYSCFRKDYYNYEFGHRPYKIKFVRFLKTDANRRDFTINCIYFDIKNKKFIDPKGGLKDIKKGLIKTVLKPQKTLKFDGERLLRLIKLKAITGFKIDKNTLKFAFKNKQNLDKLTKKMKQKYIDFFINLPKENKQIIMPLLEQFDIKIQK